ncbi:MAG TPA: methyltransferase domain-containing protein [Xanthobacteraceae bacterium]|nr:methyltransferase domain-containing protein [Xanthobacteraceae bacterium]
MTAASEPVDARAEQLARVQRYYRWLDRWVRWSRAVRPWSGFDTLTVHRLLTDPATGENGPLVLHRLMLSGLHLPSSPRVLDAGCGYGGTAFDLQPKIGGQWLGITISPIQLQRARAEATRRGLEAPIRFERRSYDAPLDGLFDLVIAIESMVHSADPAGTIANLAAHLAPGGHFVLVDDMPVENPPDELRHDIEEAKRMWRCPVMPTERGWREAFAAASLDVIRSQDFSALVYHRPLPEMTALIERDRRRAFWLGWSGLKIIPQANVGGLLLERLAVQGAMQYRLLVGRKRP